MSPSAPSPDTDAFEMVVTPVTSVSPIDDLQSIAPLILDLELRQRVLARFDGPRRLEAEIVFQCAARLTSMTEWPEEKLLEALGCPLRTYGRFTGVDLAALKRCRLFMVLVTWGAGLVDLVPDRRQVVSSSARLLKAIGGDVNALVGFLKAKDEGLTAIDFIRLGEIEGATEQVRRLAGVPSLGQELAEEDAFSEAAPIHLSSTRLQMLAEGRRLDLGPEVAQYMELHIDACEGGCKQAYEYRSSRLAAADPRA